MVQAHCTKPRTFRSSQPKPQKRGFHQLNWDSGYPQASTITAKGQEMQEQKVTSQTWHCATRYWEATLQCIPRAHSPEVRLVLVLRSDRKINIQYEFCSPLMKILDVQSHAHRKYKCSEQESNNPTFAHWPWALIHSSQAEQSQVWKCLGMESTKQRMERTAARPCSVGRSWRSPAPWPVFNCSAQASLYTYWENKTQNQQKTHR